MAAFEHEVGVVKLCQLRLFLCEGFDDRPVRVVDEHKDVRQLDRRAFADLEPRRDAGDDGPLRRADQRGRTLGIIVCIKVERQNQTRAG